MSLELFYFLEGTTVSHCEVIKTFLIQRLFISSLIQCWEQSVVADGVGLLWQFFLILLTGLDNQ